MWRWVGEERMMYCEQKAHKLGLMQGQAEQRRGEFNLEYWYNVMKQNIYGLTVQDNLMGPILPQINPVLIYLSVGFNKNNITSWQNFLAVISSFISCPPNRVTHWVTESLRHSGRFLKSQIKNASFSLYLCQFNSDLYETLNLSFWGTNQ